MTDKSIERAFRFDYGIESIIGDENPPAALPEDQVTMRPARQATAAGIDALFHFDSLESYVRNTLMPYGADDDWVFPRYFRQGLKDIRNNLVAAGSRGNAHFKDDSWMRAVEVLEANDRLLNLLHIYQNTLHKV